MPKNKTFLRALPSFFFLRFSTRGEENVPLAGEFSLARRTGKEDLRSCPIRRCAQRIARRRITTHTTRKEESERGRPSLFLLFFSRAHFVQRRVKRTASLILSPRGLALTQTARTWLIPDSRLLPTGSVSQRGKWATFACPDVSSLD